MNKASVAKVLAGLPGFKRTASFHIGKCNGAVISGYALDAPPGGIYIWRFILPSYDNVDFLHMSLGRRILAIGSSEKSIGRLNPESLDLLLRNDWKGFSSVDDAQTLLDYLEREQCVGDYCEWTKYLTHVHEGDFESASALESNWQNSGWSPGIRAVAENIQAVLEAKDRAGWEGVQELLMVWTQSTVARFCR